LKAQLRKEEQNRDIKLQNDYIEMENKKELDRNAKFEKIAAQQAKNQKMMEEATGVLDPAEVKRRDAEEARMLLEQAVEAGSNPNPTFPNPNLNPKLCLTLSCA